MEKIKKIIVNPELSIKQALKRMDEAGEKTLFVAKDTNILLGTVTDGDIRRWILKGSSLSENVSNVMNVNPIFLVEDYSKEEAKDLMVSKAIECIPIVNREKQIVSAIWWTELFNNKFQEYKEVNIPVVIMAGGEGVRLNPFTKILPKPLMPIGDKPILELVIDRFLEYKCNYFYLSVNYKSDLIKAYFNDSKRNYSIEYVEEKIPLGTIGSLYLLRDKIKTTFFLSNCDILIEADYADILNFHKTKKNKITLVSSMKHFTIPYGVCEIKNGGDLERIKEKPEYDFLVNSGMYILEPGVLFDIPENKFYNITDLIDSYIQKSERIGVYPISEQSWVDMGEWEQLQEMLTRFKVK